MPISPGRCVSRRRAPMLVAFLALFVGLNVVVPTERADAATLYYSGAGDVDRVSVIGDSVMSGMRWYGQLAPLRRFNYVVDVESCRRTVLASCRGREGYAPDNTINAMRRLSGRLAPVLVVGTGYNDPQYGFASAVDTVMAEAARQQIPLVIWVTMRETTTYTSPRGLSNAATFRANNQTLRAKAVQYGGRLRIADWSAYSANRRDWVAYDGAHLTSSGAWAMADFIADETTLALRDLRTPAWIRTVVYPTPGVGSNQVRVGWGAPRYSRSPITDYRVFHSTDGGATWRVVPEPVSTTRWVTVRDLATTHDHLFRVASYSSSGWSPLSPIVRARPRLVLPSAPTSLASTVAPTGGLLSNQVRLTWTAPTSTGLLRVTDYVVQSSSDGGATWQTMNDGVRSTTTALLSGLPHTTTFRFRVAAVTSAGRGAFSSAIAVTPRTALATAPTGLTAAVAPAAGLGDGEVRLSWSAPTYVGAPRVTDYVIWKSSDGGATWTRADLDFSPALTYVVRGLVGGTAYQFRVAAHTPIGTGARSAVVTATPRAAAPVATTTTTTTTATSVDTAPAAPSTTVAAPATTTATTVAATTT